MYERKLTKYDILKLRLPKGERNLALSILDKHGDVYLIGKKGHHHELFYTFGDNTRMIPLCKTIL